MIPALNKPISDDLITVKVTLGECTGSRPALRYNTDLSPIYGNSNRFSRAGICSVPLPVDCSCAVVPARENQSELAPSSALFCSTEHLDRSLYHDHHVQKIF